MQPGKAFVLVLLGTALAMVPVIIALGFLFAGSDDYGGGPAQGEGLRFELSFGDDGEDLDQLDDQRRELEEQFDEDLRAVEERFEERRRDVEEAFQEAVSDLEERFDEELLEQGGRPEAPGDPAELDELDEPAEPDDPAELDEPAG